LADEFPAPDREYGDEPVEQSFSGTSGDLEFGAKPEADQAPKPSAEPTFRIGDQDVPVSKVPHDTLKEWFDAATNRSKWQGENTRKAQELAEQRKAFEASQGESKQALEEYRLWDQYLKANPGLLSLIQGYHSNNPQIRNLVNQLGYAQPQGPQADPRLDALQKEFRDLKGGFEKQQTLSEMERAFNAVKAQYPDVPDEEFRAFEAQYLDALGRDDNEALYRLLFQAYVGQNKAKIEAATREQYAREKDESRKAAVERGGGSPGATLPENVDLADKTYEDLVEVFKKQEGLTT